MKTILLIVVLLGLSCSLFGWYEFYNDYEDIIRFLSRIDHRSSVMRDRIEKGPDRLTPREPHYSTGVFKFLKASKSLSITMYIPNYRQECWIGRGIYANELVAHHLLTHYHALFNETDSLIMQMRWQVFHISRDPDFNTIFYERRKSVFTFNKKKVGKDIWFGSNKERRLNDYYWTHKLLRFEDPDDRYEFIIEVLSKDKKGIQRFLKMYKSFFTGSDSAIAHNMEAFCIY